MSEIIKDTLLDTIKLIPFLFIAFLVIEFIEHKLNNNNTKILTKTKKYGSIIGSILGLIPQCGFSVMATNLYTTRIISLGTLISIYLSTSDEMLPILISHKTNLSIIIKILLIKVIFAIIYGILIDLIFQKINRKENYHICEEEQCNCKDNIIKSSIKHTINITIFILLINFIINILFEYIGENFLAQLFLKYTILSPFITSLIGLIPNCGASIVLTELYLNNSINLSSLISGLLTGSGTALIVLFKNNKNFKENIFILLLLYSLGALSGVIIEILNLFI